MEINYAQRLLNERLTEDIRDLKAQMDSLEDKFDALTTILGIEILSDEEIETCYHPCDDCEEQGHCVFEENPEEDEVDPEIERILDEIATLQASVDKMVDKLNK